MAQNAPSQTFTLESIADTYLRQGSPNQNQGDDAILRIRQSGKNRSLVRFDQNAIVAAVGGGSLVSATLELTIDSIANNWGSNQRTVDIHRLTADWTEAGATWNCADDSQPSNSQPNCDSEWIGGALYEDATDSVLHVNGMSGPVRFDVTADVVSFLAGIPNRGWLLKKFDENASGRVDYSSREGTAAEAAPRLMLVVEGVSFDEVSPILRFTAPEMPIVVGNPTPEIAVEYADGGTGVDLTSVEVRLDGTDITATCIVGAVTAACEPEALGAGEHTATATVRDLAGNVATAGLVFDLLLGSGPHIATLSAIADGYLRNGQPNQNQGSDSFLRVRQSGNNRALVRFDPSELAAVVGGSAVLAAHVELRIADNGDNWGVDGREVGAYRLKAEWTERGATWNCGDDTDLANQQADCSPQWGGGSFEPLASALVLHTNGLGGWVRFDVTADVQGLLSGTPDHGWLIKKVEEGASGRVDYTSREGIAGFGPRLVVVFEAGGGEDLEPPELSFTAPEPVVVGDPMPMLALAFSDSDSGIDAGSLTVSLDGVGVSTSCTLDAGSASCSTPALTAGRHQANASIADLAGNLASASHVFDLVLDLGPPRVTLEAPIDGSLLATSQIEVSGTVTTTRPLASLTVAALPASISGSRFTAEVTLAEGDNFLRAVATDDQDRTGSALLSVTVDTTPPVLTLLTPRDGQIVNTPDVYFSGTAADVNGVAAVSVDGQPLVLTEGRFDHLQQVGEGENTFTIRAIDAAGNATAQTLSVRRLEVPTITITAPPDLSQVTSNSVVVRGRVTGDGVSVTVAGIPASTDSAGEFLAEEVPIVAGGNILSAVATASDGSQATAKVTLFRDATPPRLEIYHPADGTVVFTPTVHVAGLVNDVVPGTVNKGEVAVTVNGELASVSNRGFLLSDLTLAPGDNLVTAVALDAGGNSDTASVRVRFITEPVRTIEPVSGDLQQGLVGDELSDPLVVRVSDPAGAPVPDRPVVFEVVAGGRFDNGRRRLAVFSDASGSASARYVLGDRAGVQRMRATAAGFHGEALFVARALPGPAALIHADDGAQQIGAAGQRLPDPLVVIVTDAAFNRLGGVPVVFRVARGAGRFDDGSQELVEVTDSDGRAAARLVLDPEEGIANNVVEATLESGPDGSRATFFASGLAVGDPAVTSISGIVLDNSNLPVPGVTLHLRGTPLGAQTGADGLFTIPGAPVGTFLLDVDGGTATRPGLWPHLEFVITTVPGRDVTLGMPIYLLPLDVDNALAVSETVGGTVTLPEVPGFALEVAPGSVMFPDGSRIGLVHVTLVHGDKMPMVPNFGQQPRFIVTIQPAGALFDPPARMTLPNTDGLPPGASTEMYSFDHDLGSFVSIGPASVSDDGTVVVSDPGVGIVKAGWHCGGNPASSGTPHQCPPCQICDGSQCVTGCALSGLVSAADFPLAKAAAGTACGCSDGDPCTVNDRCEGSGCVGDRKRIVSVDIVADEVAQARQPIDFFALVESEHCPASEQSYLWDFGDGATSTAAAPSHAYAFPGEYDVELKVSCRGCPGTTRSDTSTVKVIDILVLSADVTAGADGEIDVFLAPDGTTGMLTLELLNPDSHRVLSQARPGGLYTESFNIPGLAAGDYMNVKGTWEVEGVEATDQIDYQILVLGVWRHSQYNTPQDLLCDGEPVQSYVTVNDERGNSQCFNDPPADFHTLVLPQRFVDEVNENGSGNIDGIGDVQADGFCPTTAAAPADAPRHTFRQQDIVPSCGTNLDATTVAGCLGDEYLGDERGDERIACGDQIFVHTVGVKEVTDNCPACCEHGRQFDNYTLNGACAGIGDLGNFMTIKLFP